ncbi:MAG: hypothetical protein M1508_07155 [Nitrospirae bacterium]|nr:hypothetical protein [Nitrospirota bacterium]
MTSHGFAFYRARAVASWNAPLIPFLFLISSFTMGFGMVLLAAALNGLTFKLDSMVIGLTFVVLNLVTWLIYMNWYRDRAFKEATEVLHRTIPLILTVGIGHLLPSLLLLLLLIDSTGVKAQPIILVLCGLAIVTGGVGQKADIILRANYLRGIVMGQPKVSAKVVSPT